MRIDNGINKQPSHLFFFFYGIFFLLDLNISVLQYLILKYYDFCINLMFKKDMTNHDGLNNLRRGYPKKHFCQIILKSVQWFLTRF